MPSSDSPRRFTDRSTHRFEGRFVDRVVAITGAGSGIGRALAVEVAIAGAHPALCDVSATALAETVALVSERVAAGVAGRGVQVSSQVVDVADRDAVFGWADEVVAAHQRVNMIINNAGVAVVSPVGALDVDNFEWLMDINFWGVVHGTQAFLPLLKQSGDGHVVNISSVFGLTAVPGQAAYNSAKFAVRGFTDCLRMELEVEPCGVSATTVHPGGIRTNIARSARYLDGGDHEAEIDLFDRIARTTPEAAARQILAGVAKNRRRVLVGPDAVAFDAVSRLPAAVPQRLFAAVARRRLKQQAR